MDAQAAAQRIQAEIAALTQHVGQRPAVMQERRAPNQPPERFIGHLVACGGARGVVVAQASTAAVAASERWSVGSLITLHAAASRIVCFVYDMASDTLSWRDGSNQVHIKIEFVGEIIDSPSGRPVFRRGIGEYPMLGTPAHLIRHNDLAAIYDLGERKSATIGTLAQDSTIPATVNIDDLLKKHFAVVGTTGAGKSVSTSILLRKALEAKSTLRILILDPHNEFTAPFRDVAMTLDANTLELPFWMFKFDELSEVVFRGRPPAEGEADFLRQAIVQAKSIYSTRATASAGPTTILKKAFSPDGGGATADTPVPYRIADIFKLIDEQIGKLEAKYNRLELRALKDRLDQLWHDPRYRFMFGKASLEDTTEPLIANLFRVPQSGFPVTVVQLAGIPSDVVNSVVSVLARVAFDLSMLSAGRYEILVLCEEAHRYVPADVNRGFLPTRFAISRIAKEGRKYGCYLGVVTQRPGELDPTILSQCSTIFAMRLANDYDQEIIRAAIPDSSAGVLTFLSSMSNREAIAFGEGIATPMRVRFSNVDISLLPNNQMVDVVAQGLTTGGLLDLHGIVERMRGQSEAYAPPGYSETIAAPLPPMPTPSFGLQPGAPTPPPGPTLPQMPTMRMPPVAEPPKPAPSPARSVVADYRHLLGREITR